MIEDSFLMSIIRNKDRVDMWADFISKAPVRSVVEVGVWRGAFAQAMLKTCEGISEYHLVDPWRSLPHWNKPLNVSDDIFEEAYAETVRNMSEFGDKARLWRGTSQEVIDQFTDKSMDFIYIDGDHTLRGISLDLILWSPKVKQGCFLAGDDFCPTIWQHDPRYEPTLVFPFALHFAEAMGYRVYGLPFNQFLIEISGDGSRTFQFVDLAGVYGDTQLLKQINQRPGYVSRGFNRASRRIKGLLSRWRGN